MALTDSEIAKGRAKLSRRKLEKGNRIPDELRDQIAREYANDEASTTHSLGAKHNISATTVSNILRESLGLTKGAN